MTDSFATYDAAYLLGALTSADRAAFEAHLTECADCRRGVNQLAGLPGLLASVSADQMRSLDEPVPAVPETLLPRLLREVQRTRFRRRVATGAIGLVAAAVLAIALLVGLHSAGSEQAAPRAGGAAGTLTLSPVSGTPPIRATARLADRSWGTRIVVRCIYTGAARGYPDGSGATTYTLVVTDDSGATQQVAAWEAHPGGPMVVDGSTSVPLSEISSIQVRDWVHKPVLTLVL